MEIVDYDKIKGWEINKVTEVVGGTPKGFIVRLVGESGKETKIMCSPAELMELQEAIQDIFQGRN